MTAAGTALQFTARRAGSRGSFSHGVDSRSRDRARTILQRSSPPTCCGPLSSSRWPYSSRCARVDGSRFPFWTGKSARPRGV